MCTSFWWLLDIIPARIEVDEADYSRHSNVSNTAYFEVAEVASTITVSKGKQYTIGTDVVSFGNATINFGNSTLQHPSGTSISTSTTRPGLSNSSTSTSLATSSPQSAIVSTTSHLSTASMTPPISSGVSESVNSTGVSPLPTSYTFLTSVSVADPSSNVPISNGTGVRPTDSSSSSRSDSSSLVTSNPGPAGPVTSESYTYPAAITSMEGPSAIIVPITVVAVSKGRTTSHVTYKSTLTSSKGIQPTGAWMCMGPLCDIRSDCLVPLFCRSRTGSSGSWGLCCGWEPPSSGGKGSGPPAGGPQVRKLVLSVVLPSLHIEYST